MKIPVIALKNKSKEDRYLACSMDAGDWDDEDLDVTIENIQNAFLIFREDFSVPNERDVADLKAESDVHKKYMVERYGDDAIISFDVEKWLEFYEPVNLEITKEQFDEHVELSAVV